MLKTGEKIKTDAGTPLTVKNAIGSGGEGITYLVQTSKGEKGIMKLFHSQFANDVTRERIRFLVGQNLAAKCQTLYGPAEAITSVNHVGHFASKATGRTMDEFLADPQSTFLECLTLACSVAHSIAALHADGISHGDIHSGNFMVNRNGSVLELACYDFDNYNHNAVPDPSMLGQQLYLAPELRQAAANKQPAIPTIESDLFSLACLLHEVILLKSVASGFDASKELFEEAMVKGKWLHDKAAGNSNPQEDPGGFPVDILNSDLARLFRQAVSLTPTDRPSALEWKEALNEALHSIFLCPRCDHPVIIDSSKMICPFCSKKYPHLILKTSNGTEITLENGSTLLTRESLDGSQYVSAHHAIIRRRGPEFLLESKGSNGTFRFAGGNWIKLPNEKAILIQGNDKLRFADIEASLSYSN